VLTGPIIHTMCPGNLNQKRMKMYYRKSSQKFQ
jgi:hypothetical protein